LRANPSTGVTFQLDRLRTEIDRARSPEAEAETRQLNLNIVSGSGRKWLSTAAWQACNKMQVQPKKLIKRHCYGGVDISFGNDLTGFALAFPNWEPYQEFASIKDPRIDLLCWAWVPEKNLETRCDIEKFPYLHHAKGPYLFDDRGPVRTCYGSVIDYAQVCQDITEICKLFQVQAIAYDPNYAQFTVPSLEAEGFTMIAHRQGAVSMSPICKQFSQMVYRGQLAHGANPVLDRCVEGAVLHRPDKAGNTYLSKGDSHARIDVLVAAVMAVGFATNPPEDTSGAYTSESAGMWG
jgi:phage terminase large subunit-like protein